MNQWIFWVIVTIVLLLVYMLIYSYRYRIRNLSITFKNLPEGFDGVQLFFISDVHARTIPNWLIEKVKKQHSIEVVLIGGDFVHKGVPLSRARKNLQLLKSLGPVYFVWGNHDEEVEAHELDVLFLEEKVKVLNNEAVRFENFQGEVLWLLGVDDLCSNRDRLRLALQDTQEEEGFRILLSHAPSIVMKIKPEDRIFLVLSGHTHGGQISLPFIGPLLSIFKGYFPKYVSGLYDLGYTKLFVTNGFGTIHVPFRLWTSPEVVVITLKKG